MKIRALVLLLAAATTGLAAFQAEPDIDRADVERVIRTLASDEMEGRQAFTPAAARAAEFIRGELAAIGLDTLADLDGYLQEFPVYSLSVERLTADVNGEEIADEDVAVSLSSRSLQWTSGDDTEIVTVGADENPMEAFQASRRSGVDTLYLISRAHRDVFGRIRAFMSRSSRSLELSGGTDSVFVLTDETSVDSYLIEASASVEEQTLANVVGVIPGERTDELVVFSAHYDHIGIRNPTNGDSIANGANDDASGTTAVIELARYFKSLGTPVRTLLFVAFTAEESGGYGSRYFSTRLDPERIVAMFNIEMIGKVAAQGPNTVWVTGFDRSSFGQILQRAVEGTGYAFLADPYPDQNLFYRSDNATLARLGVPAHSLSTTPIDVDPDYHQVSDEVETLDLDHVTSTIRAIALAADPIVSGEATPTRVDPRGLRE